MKTETTNVASIQAALRCRESRELERQGEYEEARRRLGDLFPPLGGEPEASGLSEDVRAEVYLRCGVVSGFYFSARGLREGQAHARRLLEYSHDLYEVLGDRDKQAEALSAQAVTLWREGELKQADRLLELAAVRAGSDEPKAVALINRAIVAHDVGDYGRVLDLLAHAADFVHENDHYPAGIYYHALAKVNRAIGEEMFEPARFQVAIVHITGALYHYERLGHRRYGARGGAILGNLYRLTFEFVKAEESLTRALRTAEDLKDRTLAGQIYDTLAQTYRDWGKRDKAKTCAREAIRLLEESGEDIPLAEAHRTLASILHPEQSDWRNFSLDACLLAKERELITRAILESGGITRAAEKLGVKVPRLRMRIDRTFPELDDLIKPQAGKVD